ncbi:MAG: SufD family Fe-S cluster assembly protein [Alistipes sp.]|nr:SufD family Fe-S cluster assembly protein [Candidatus Alistipes equi]
MLTQEYIATLRKLRSGKLPQKGNQLFFSRMPSTLNLQVERLDTLRKAIFLFDESRFSSVDIYLEQGAAMDIYLIQTSSSAVSLNIHQQQDSVSHIFLSQSASGKTNIEVELLGLGAQHTCEGFFITSGEENSSINLAVKHLSSDTTSSTLIRGVGMDHSSARFHGLVYVNKNTKHVDASQLSQNIALDDARILSEPQLEIYADDVKCSHGSTVGKLSEQALGYMRQRGISLQKARNMLIEGFLKDTMKNYSIPELMEQNEILIGGKLNFSDDVQR